MIFIFLLLTVFLFSIYFSYRIKRNYKFLKNKIEAYTNELEEKNKELQTLLEVVFEKSRFENLGEIAALVLHDLKGPLQAIKFCLEEGLLKENFDERKKLQYLKQLKINCDHLFALVHSLQIQLKEPKNHLCETEVSFLSAHGHVLKLLEVQFQNQFFKKIHFILEPPVSGLYLKILQSDLVHILYNLYKNSIQNFIESNVQNPEIKIRCEALEKNFVKIYLTDNGKGLSPEQFEFFTNEFIKIPGTPTYRGLGMRLTRRLIERYHGKLAVVKSPFEKISGTTFELQLEKIS